jgi:hypothetical protein
MPVTSSALLFHCHTRFMRPSKFCANFSSSNDAADMAGSVYTNMVWLISEQMQASVLPLLLKAREMTPSPNSAQGFFLSSGSAHITANTLQSDTRHMITRPLGPS